MYTLKYKSDNGRSIPLHFGTGTSELQGVVVASQTGLTGVDVEFVSAQNRVGSVLQGRFVKGKDIVLRGTIAGPAEQIVKELFKTIVPEVPGKLIYNDTIYLEVDPKTTPIIAQYYSNTEFQMVFYAPYPYWKDMNETVIPMARVVKMFSLPSEITEFQLGEANYSAEGTVTNDGDLPVPVRARMQFGGFVNNPFVKNHTTGEIARIGHGFVKDETLTIDTTQVNVGAYGNVAQPPMEYTGWLSAPPGGSVNAVAFSPDGTLLAAGFSGGLSAACVAMYSVGDGGAITKLPNLPASPVGTSSAVRFSPDGKLLVIGHVNSPYVSIYKVNDNNTFTKLSNPAQLPTSGVVGVSFSQDGGLLALAHGTAPYVTVYEVSGGSTFTKLANLSSLPTGGALDVAFSPDGKFLAVGLNTAPYLEIYTVWKNELGSYVITPIPNGGVVTPGSGNPIPGPGRAVAFSPGGNLLAVGHANSPFMTVFRVTTRTNEGEAQLPGIPPAETPAFIRIPGGALSAPNDLSFSPNGSIIAGVSFAAPTLAMYEVSENIVTPLPTPAVLPQSANGVAFYPGGKLLAVGHTGEPYITAYRGESEDIPLTQAVSIDSTIVTLQPGDNHIEFGSSNGNDDIKGEVIIRREYVGAWKK